MITLSHIFFLPTDAVSAFRYLSHPENDTIWQKSCSEVILESGVPMLGARYRICFKLLGKTMRFLVEIRDFQPSKFYEFEVIEGPFYYRGQYSFQEQDAVGAINTQITWHFFVDSGKFFGILPSNLLKKVLLSQVEADTSRLASHWTSFNTRFASYST